MAAGCKERLTSTIDNAAWPVGVPHHERPAEKAQSSGNELDPRGSRDRSLTFAFLTQKIAPKVAFVNAAAGPLTSAFCPGLAILYHWQLSGYAGHMLAVLHTLTNLHREYSRSGSLRPSLYTIHILSWCAQLMSATLQIRLALPAKLHTVHPGRASDPRAMERSGAWGRRTTQVVSHGLLICSLQHR